MARWDHLQSDFGRGELSPLMAGRRDSPDFARGLATCLNAIVGPRGEWVRRPGTKHFRDTINNQPTRLVDMVTAEQRPILLEFSAGQVRINDFDGASHSTAAVASPFSGDDIWHIDWAQSGNSLFIVHPNHPPQWLYPDAGGQWQMHPLILVDGPYLRQNTTTSQMLGADGAGLYSNAGFAPFTSADVGRGFRIRDQDGTWHTAKIWTVPSASRANVAWDSAETITALANGRISPTWVWQLGAFWADNYPTSVCFHEDRLVLAATASNPQSFWASQTGDYTNFGPSQANGDVLASDAIFAALNDRQINRIQWLASAQESLVAGTASGLWLVGGEGGSAMTPAGVQAQRLSGATSADVRPTSVGRSTLFVERSGRRLLALKRDTVELVYLTPNISMRSEHLLTSGISAMAHQAVPWSSNWCLMNDGTLAGLTIEDDNEVLGWHRHQIGGPAARVLSIATLPGVRADNGRKQDRLFMVVERTLTSGVHHSVEVLGDAFEHDTDLSHAEYLDGAIKTQSAAPFRYVAGLGHLAGLDVAGLSDGRPTANYRVPSDANAAVTMDSADAGEVVILGLAFETQAQMQDIDASSLSGLSDGKPRHVYEVILRLWRTVGLEASTDGAWVEYSGDDVRRLHDPAGQWLNGRDEPYSGGLRIKRDAGGWARQVKVGWRTSSPLPLCVLSVLLRFADSDG